METITDVLKRRDSWPKVLALIQPYIAPQHTNMLRPAKELWDSLPLQRQRQIWVTLWERKMRGAKIKDHPYYAIKDCVTIPYDWNGTDHLDSMMKCYKMVKARYYNRYGIFTLKAAQAFALKEVEPLNYKRPDKKSDNADNGGTVCDRDVKTAKVHNECTRLTAETIKEK